VRRQLDEALDAPGRETGVREVAIRSADVGRGEISRKTVPEGGGADVSGGPGEVWIKFRFSRRGRAEVGLGSLCPRPRQVAHPPPTSQVASSARLLI